VYAAAAPLIICGAAVAANAAAREDWPRLGVAMAMIAVGAGSAYAGTIGVWAIAGVGCCMVLLGCAVAQADHVHIVPAALAAWRSPSMLALHSAV
jgi:hypothetical protein